MKYQAHWAVRLGVLTLLTTTAGTSAEVIPHAGMLRYPDVSREHIVFAYANDLWIADREGGMARPLASPPGSEALPRFSEDGQTIAFMGNYDGGRDIYTISIYGGAPHRVTHHPGGEILCDWTPDGRLLFYGMVQGGMPRARQMYFVDAAGGLPEELPIPYGSFGSISDDGVWLAYTPYSRERRTWKRYMGGLATDIWLFNLQTHESEKITDWEGTDALPMWHGDKIYYLSDAGENHRLNIWCYDTKTGDREQITRFRDFDVKWPSMGPGESGGGEIIFQNGAALYLYDLRGRSSREIKVQIPGDRPTIRPQRVDASDFIQAWDISATGKRAVVQARGDIWTLPAEHGSPRNLTRTDGVAERRPAWSPDGKWLAYFSDGTGEYELYITQSDGKGETKQITHDSQTFYYGVGWSPDSKWLVYFNKAFEGYLYNLETEETRYLGKDPWGTFGGMSWSHDSRWIAYARSDEERPMTTVWLYNVENDEHHKVTSGMFSDSQPTFDRKGDYLYFASGRHFSPTYSDVDNSFIYDESEVLIAVPLRKDVESPYLLESDEESWDEGEEAKADEGEEAAEGDDKAAHEEAAAEDEGDKPDAANGEGDEAEEETEVPRHPLHGVWEGSISGMKSMLESMIPPDAGIEIPDTAPYTLNIVVDEEGNISGTSTVEIMGQSQTDELGEVTFNEDTGEYVETDEKEGTKSVMRGKLEGDTLSGTWEVTGNMTGSGTWTVTKTEKEPEVEEEAAEVVEIDLDGFEQRAIQLDVPNGNFGQLAVNDKNQLIYLRRGEGIKLFDIDDEKKAEKTVAGMAMGFAISGDGKKLLVITRGGAKIQNAAAGASGKPVVEDPMDVIIDPRVEWKQLFNDVWRIYRDFFYVENMHGVDWPAMREHYAAMLDDCVTREDVSYVISELISELNVGHAYYFGGDEEDEEFRNVGLLGVDFALDQGAYQIAKIYEGAPWDVDARNPLREPGVDVKEGDYLLAVNGVPLDTSVDPWAPFIGLAGKEVVLTVSEKPEMDDDARTVVIKPMRSDMEQRYRGWIEENRKHVEEATDGRVGYIYVPDTGRRGQSDLVRQYFGQLAKDALVIDERWNGGGQIPTRFIEMLNRPITNFWARRDGHDWKWPPDAHHGPKCMLINGAAGSGGDHFPWLFRLNKLGKLIGTRTWGGLVGISGNPGLIDGGYASVPTFGIYEADGTWAVEGHGVDPDIEVIDDPALMVDGGDPQLDAAINLMLQEIEAGNVFTWPQRPPDPDRSGMGIRQEDQ